MRRPSSVLVARLLAAASLGLSFLLDPTPTTAQEAPRASAPQVTEAPTVDGRLDDAAWATAPVLTDFVQREPYEGTPVTQRTEVRMVADAEALYIAA